jgi:hypothetical protein
MGNSKNKNKDLTSSHDSYLGPITGAVRSVSLGHGPVLHYALLSDLFSVSFHLPDRALKITLCHVIILE